MTQDNHAKDPIQATPSTSDNAMPPINPHTTPAAAAPDPFDPSRFRLNQDMLAAGAVKKLLTTVPVRKPSKEWFVRCHPDEQFWFRTYVIELKEDAETYLVDPTLWPQLAGESTFSPRLLIVTQNKQGALFLWPIRLPGPDGRHDEWSKSAIEAASRATRSWVRTQANISLGAYEIYSAADTGGDVNWELPSLGEILKIAFMDRLIETLEHPVLKRLRGEV